MELVASALGGDASAREQLANRMVCVHRYLRTARGAFERAPGSLSIEDVEQETVMRAWQSAARFDGTSKLETWLIGVARNVLQESLRRRSRELRQREVGDDSPLDEMRGPGESPLEQVENRLALEAIQGAIASTSALDQKILRGKAQQGLTFRELAVNLDTPVNTIKSRYYRLVHSIRERLGVQVGGPQRPPAGGGGSCLPSRP